MFNATQSADELFECSAFLKNFLGLEHAPENFSAIILGSGLSELANDLKNSKDSKSIPYKNIPYFSRSTVEGHSGELIYGQTKCGAKILALSGRVHGYEGYEPHNIIFPVRILKLLGVHNLILTNAAGALADHFKPGQIMLITDQINLTGHSPLVGPNLNHLGPRFVDLSEVYDRKMRDTFKSAAKNLDLTLHEGVYAGMLGPCYETPAEVRMLKILGAHAVGMSTVFEAIAARHMQMNVLGISCLTNMAAGLSANKINHEEVIENNKKVSQRLNNLMQNFFTQFLSEKK